MKRRLKRFKPKAEFSHLLKCEIDFGDGKVAQGEVTSLSLMSLGVMLESKFEKHVDSAGSAKILFSENDIAIGRVFLLHTVSAEEASLRLVDEAHQKRTSKKVAVSKDKTPVEDKKVFIFRTLEANVPVEELMRAIQNQEGNSPYDFELTHGKFTVADFYAYNGTDDILEKTNLFLSMQKSFQKKNVYQYERFRKDSKGKRVQLDRKRSNGSNEYIIFGSNDYLGLAAHPEVISAAHNALDIYGLGSTGSPLTTGITQEHIQLQDLLADMFQKESTLLYNSGYSANIGILSAVCRKDDLVLYDKLSHASIVDALKMCVAEGATCIPFKHNDMEDLQRILEEKREEYTGCLIVTEGIFSMDGYIANIKDIVDLAKQYNARTFLDVAHDFGVIGENGLGAAEYHGVLNQVDIIMGTFSKIGGGIGGFCAASEGTVEYLRMMSRAYMFSVSLPPAVVAGVYKGLKIFWEDKSYLNTLKSNIRYFVTELIKIGVQLDPNHSSTICPVVIGDEKKLDQMTKILFDKGIFVTPIMFPAVSRSQSRFRFTVSAAHSRTDLDYAILALQVAFEKIGFDPEFDLNQKKAS